MVVSPDEARADWPSVGEARNIAFKLRQQVSLPLDDKTRATEKRTKVRIQHELHERQTKLWVRWGIVMPILFLAAYFMLLQLFTSRDSPVPGPWRSDPQPLDTNTTTRSPVDWKFKTGPLRWHFMLEQLPSIVLLLFFTILQVVLFFFGALRQIHSLFGPTETKISTGTFVFAKCCVKEGEGKKKKKKEDRRRA